MGIQKGFNRFLARWTTGSGRRTTERFGKRWLGDILHQEAGYEGRELVAFCKRPIPEKGKKLIGKEAIEEFIQKLASRRFSKKK